LDVVYPAKEQNALFLTTNVLQTMGQTRGFCIGSDPDTESCATQEDCIEGKPSENGFLTGVCNTSVGWCEVQAWCPVENEPQFVTNYIQRVENFTIFIRSTVEFPKYGIMRSNADKIQEGYNIFQLGYMVEQAGYNYYNLRQKGAVIGVFLNWNCDLDRNLQNCLPSFVWKRLDDPSSQQSVGYNFRYTTYYEANDTEYRNMYKLWGIRLVFSLTGSGRKFSIVALTVTVGSGLAFLGVATLITDFILLKLMPPRDHYRKAKYAQVKRVDVNGNVDYEKIESHPST